MGQPVIHFEVIGTEAGKLRGSHGDLFGWESDTSGPVAPADSEAGEYGFVNRDPSGGEGYAARAVFSVGVPDVEAALQNAERPGGTRAMGPERAPGASLVVAHFTDPDGNLIGLASTA